jgi:hypothetical protein
MTAERNLRPPPCTLNPRSSEHLPSVIIVACPLTPGAPTCITYTVKVSLVDASLLSDREFEHYGGHRRVATLARRAEVFTELGATVSAAGVTALRPLGLDYGKRIPFFSSLRLAPPIAHGIEQESASPFRQRGVLPGQRLVSIAGERRVMRPSACPSALCSMVQHLPFSFSSTPLPTAANFASDSL